TPLPEPIPISEQKWPEGTLPLVTTRTMTFNQEAFIRDCLDGILMQKTTFPVQVLIHDDASTDNTVPILREYEHKYPGLIQVFYQPANTHTSKNKHQLRNAFFDWIKGKYLALCEGDDYWTAPDKLQKQVRFLEENPDHVLSCGGYRAMNSALGTSKEVVENDPGIFPSGNGSRFSFDLNAFGKKWITKTLTIVYKRSAVDLKILDRYQSRKDIHLFYHILKNGKGIYFQEVFGVYNIHSGGVYSLKGRKTNIISNFRSYAELYEYNRDNFTRERYLHHLTTKFAFELRHEFFPLKIRDRYHEVKKIVGLTASFKEFKGVLKLLLVEMFILARSK
ncbi:MAG: glycosyltransferase, partial [Cyclobacteriaceae bacterium]